MQVEALNQAAAELLESETAAELARERARARKQRQKQRKQVWGCKHGSC